MLNEKVKVCDKTFRPMIDHLEIISAIDDVANKLNRDFKDVEEPPILLCVLNGAIPFTAELMKRLEFPHRLESVSVKSFCGTKSIGKVTIDDSNLSFVEGKTVIISEDLVDSGISIYHLKKALFAHGAKEVKVCVLLFKPENFNKNKEAMKAEGVELTAPDYAAMTIGDAFIVGFGMDYFGLGRNYKDIYVLDN